MTQEREERASGTPLLDAMLNDNKPLSAIPVREGDTRFQSLGTFKRVFSPEDEAKMELMPPDERRRYMRELVEQNRYTRVRVG